MDIDSYCCYCCQKKYYITIWENVHLYFVFCGFLPTDFVREPKIHEQLTKCENKQKDDVKKLETKFWNDVWVYFVILSAVFLGVYDICKKVSLKKNAVLVVMFLSSSVSLLMLSPIIADSFFSFGWFDGTVFFAPKTSLRNQLFIILKDCFSYGNRFT